MSMMMMMMTTIITLTALLMYLYASGINNSNLVIITNLIEILPVILVVFYRHVARYVMRHRAIM